MDRIYDGKVEDIFVSTLNSLIFGWFPFISTNPTKILTTNHITGTFNITCINLSVFLVMITHWRTGGGEGARLGCREVEDVRHLGACLLGQGGGGQTLAVQTLAGNVQVYQRVGVLPVRLRLWLPQPAEVKHKIPSISLQGCNVNPEELCRQN